MLALRYFNICAICLLSFNYNQPSFSSKHSGQKLSTLRVYLIFYFNNLVESTLHPRGRHGGVKIYRNSGNYITISLLIYNGSGRWNLLHSTSFTLFIMSLSLVFRFFYFSRISPFLLFCPSFSVYLFVYIQFVLSQFL